MHFTLINGNNKLADNALPEVLCQDELRHFVALKK